MNSEQRTKNEKEKNRNNGK